MKKYKSLLVSSILTIVVVFACKKEKPELNPAADPCACASEVTADFDILERHIQLAQSEFIVTDHVLSNKSVYFRAKEDGAEYTWYIGLDVETTQETWKQFDNTWTGSTIPITLVVKKDPNLICFPDDDGYDSVVKTFNIYDRCVEPYPLEGVFRVAPINSTDSIDIEIEFNEYPPQNDCYSVDITNFDGEGSICPGNYFRVTKSYRYMQQSQQAPIEAPDGNCQGIGGGFRAWIHLNGVCEIKYHYYKDSDINQQINQHLFGRKLN